MSRVTVAFVERTTSTPTTSPPASPIAAITCPNAPG
jgi:hypothetical protein